MNLGSNTKSNMENKLWQWFDETNFLHNITQYDILTFSNTTKIYNILIPAPSSKTTCQWQKWLTNPKISKIIIYHHQHTPPLPSQVIPSQTYHHLRYNTDPTPLWMYT